MISLPILLASLGCVMAFELTPVHEWTRIEYRWSSESEKKLAIETGQYNYTNVFLYDAEWYKGKLFVTTPRTYDVNPASLSTVSEKFDAKGAALLQPYPSPEWHIVGNCSGITNALRFVIDKCGNMWIVDSGRIGNKVICPAQILKFDLETDQLIMRYEIPEKVSKGGLLSTSAVRTEGAECEEIMVFAADVRGRGYVIFDGSTSWRLDSDNFAPDVDSGNITVANRTVDIPDGPVAFMTLDKKFADIELGLMWSWTGRHAYGLSIQDLIKSRDSQENLKWYRNEYELSTSAPAGIVSREGIIFGAFIGPQKLKCAWLGNIVILENVEELIGESEIQLDIINLKITTDDDENEYLWFTANNYLQLRAGDTNFRKVNARIYVVNVADIINGTRCQPKAHVVPAKSWAEKGYIPLKEHDDVNT